MESGAGRRVKIAALPLRSSGQYMHCILQIAIALALILPWSCPVSLPYARIFCTATCTRIQGPYPVYIFSQSCCTKDRTNPGLDLLSRRLSQVRCQDARSYPPSSGLQVSPHSEHAEVCTLYKCSSRPGPQAA